MATANRVYLFIWHLRVAKYINVAQRSETISLLCLFDLGGWTLDTGHFFQISPTQPQVFLDIL